MDDWDVDMDDGGFRIDTVKYRVVMATKWVKEKNGYQVRLVVIEEYAWRKRKPEFYACCMQLKNKAGFLFSSYSEVLEGAERTAKGIISRNKYGLWTGVKLHAVKNSERLYLREIKLDYETHRKLRYISDKMYL